MGGSMTGARALLWEANAGHHWYEKEDHPPLRQRPAQAAPRVSVQHVANASMMQNKYLSVIGVGCTRPDLRHISILII